MTTQFLKFLSTNNHAELPPIASAQPAGGSNFLAHRGENFVASTIAFGSGLLFSQSLLRAITTGPPEDQKLLLGTALASTSAYKMFAGNPEVLSPLTAVLDPTKWCMGRWIRSFRN